MIRTLRYSLALGCAAMLTACIPVELDIEREFDIVVDVTEEIEEAISSEELLDLGGEEAFKEAGDSIQKVEIKSATLQITSIDEETNAATKLSGTVEFSNGEEDAERKLLAKFEDFEIALGDAKDLNLDAAGVEELRKLVQEEPHKFKVFVKGSTDEFPAKFQARLGLHIGITVAVDPATLAEKL